MLEECMCTLMAAIDDPFHPCRMCTCSALRRAGRTVTQHYEREFRGSSLRATQFTLLATLIQAGPIPLGQLADLAGLERTTLTRNLRPLEKRGLVRSHSTEDGRVRRLAITPDGERLALQHLPAWQRAQASVASVLTQLGLPEIPAPSGA
jgi:DNA-binding MarR family transcriptional regulator